MDERVRDDRPPMAGRVIGRERRIAKKPCRGADPGRRSLRWLCSGGRIGKVSGDFPAAVCLMTKYVDGRLLNGFPRSSSSIDVECPHESDNCRIAVNHDLVYSHRIPEPCSQISQCRAQHLAQRGEITCRLALIIGDDVGRKEIANLLLVTRIECRSPVLDRRADRVLVRFGGLGRAGRRKRQNR